MTNTLADAVGKALDHSRTPADDALALLHYLEGRMGWSILAATREDTQQVVGEVTGRFEDEPALTDEEWDAISGRIELGSNDMVMECFWAEVRAAVEAMLPPERLATDDDIAGGAEHQRTCDRCGRVTLASDAPDWPDGICEICEPALLDAAVQDPTTTDSSVQEGPR